MEGILILSRKEQRRLVVLNEVEKEKGYPMILKVRGKSAERSHVEKKNLLLQD